MTAASLAWFMVASVLLALSPGPDILTVITRSITQGVRAGLVATLGFASGVIVHTTAAALGLSLLLRESPRALLTIQIAGVVYLLYLAVRVLMSKDVIAIDANTPQPVRALGRIYWQSVLMNVLNPKVTLFFFAFLSQFVRPESAVALPLQFVIYGGIFAMSTIICFGACAILSGRLTAWLRKKPGAARPIRIATALIFVAIAVRLALIRLN